ncbi:polysaccharide pyruvyl transferase family protein [Streptomyces sp. NPDC058691]|uniref:polysaccharide pyruvyl transferase family protein n=1 Tax=Streptomyces sp. NPDC058691 TaxID=3346601 RepID=UPI0036629867
MKRILLRSGKSPFDVVSHEQAMHRNVIGTNSGNLIFSDAAHKLLLTPETEVVSTNRFTVDPAEAGRINEEFDAFVVPLANAFRPSFAKQLNTLSKLIEQLTIPVVVLGVGAQATVTYDTARLAGIERPVKRFVKAVLDRSASIGVRGECTERYLKGLGFRDVDVIGCPSMFLYGDHFAVEKKAAGIGPDSRIAVNGSHDALRTGHLGTVMDAAIDRYPDLTYVAQNLTDAELLYWGDVSDAAGLHQAVPAHRTHRLLRENKVRIYVDPVTWIDDLRQYDYSFGGRIHGNIAALLAGTPATVLCHDSRTLELCRYFGIPHLRATDVTPDLDPAILYEKADFGELLNDHKVRFGRLTAFLDRNGLQNTYSHGDRGAAFESRMASLSFPPAIEAWQGEEYGRLGYRIGWLKHHTDRARQEQQATARLMAESAARTAQLEARIELLEKRLVSVQGRSAVRRARRAMRPVKKMFNGLS